MPFSLSFCMALIWTLLSLNQGQLVQQNKGAKPAAKVKPASDELVKAFRRFVYAYYDYNVLEDVIRIRGKKLDKEAAQAQLIKLQAQEAKAREALAKHLGIKAEAKPGVFHKRFAAALKARKDLLMLPIVSDDKRASLQVVGFKGSVEGQDPRLGKQRSVMFFGEKHSYRSVAFDAHIVLSYERYRAHSLDIKRPFQAVTFRDKTFFIERNALVQLGRAGFWQRLDYYRKVEKYGIKVGSYRAFVNNPAKMFALTKDMLRWRSMRRLAQNYEAASQSEQDQAFLEDYARGEELRALAQVVEHERLKKRYGKGAKSQDWDSKTRQLLAERALYSAMMHGDARGTLAGILGLALQQIHSQGAVSEQHSAALAVVIGLKNEIKKAAPGKLSLNDAEAFAFHRMATMSQLALRELARKKYKQRQGATLDRTNSGKAGSKKGQGAKEK